MFESGSVQSHILGELDLWGLSVSNNKHIGEPGGKSFALCVSDSDNIERTLMSFSMSNNSNTTCIISSSNISNIA